MPAREPPGHASRGVTLLHRAGLAQSVEHFSCKEDVVGSIPTPGSDSSSDLRRPRRERTPRAHGDPHRDGHGGGSVPTIRPFATWRGRSTDPPIRRFTDPPIHRSADSPIRGGAMKAAVLTEYNEPLVVEEITLGTLGPTQRAPPRGRQRRVPLRPQRRRGQGADGRAADPRPRGRRHRARGRARTCSGSRTATRSSRRSSPACGQCFFCLHDQSQLCEAMGAAIRRRRRARGPTAATSSA